VTTQIGLSGAQVTVRDPDVPEEIRRDQVATARRAIDGTMRKQITASKREWHYRWTRLTSAENTTLLTELVREATLVLSPPDGGSYNVIVDPGTLVTRRSEIDDYEVESVLKEV